MLPLRQAFRGSLQASLGTPSALRVPRHGAFASFALRNTGAFSTSLLRHQENASSRSPKVAASAESSEASTSSQTPQTRITLQTPEPRLSMTFTCTAEGCHTRSTHSFTKRSYEKGIVIVECPGCKNRHLIADHLGWFKESTENGKLKTVEDILRARGEKVRRGTIDSAGVVEYAPE